MKFSALAEAVTLAAMFAVEMNVGREYSRFFFPSRDEYMRDVERFGMHAMRRDALKGLAAAKENQDRIRDMLVEITKRPANKWDCHTCHWVLNELRLQGSSNSIGNVIRLRTLARRAIAHAAIDAALGRRIVFK